MNVCSPRLLIAGTAIAILVTGAAHAQPSDITSPAKPAEAPRSAAKSVAESGGGFVSPDHREKLAAMIAKTERFLRSQQDPATGGWSLPKPAAEGKTPPSLPGISALVLQGLLMNPAAGGPDDAVTARGEKFLLNFAQPDGGVYDRMLPSYNTALSVSAFSRMRSSRAKEAMAKGVAFLRQLQYSESSSPDIGGSEAPKAITKDHIFYGGVGYGRHGRPDNSNLGIYLQAMQDAGVSPDDESVQRALVFLKRTQMDDRINDQDYAKGSRQGGFVYATVENAQSVDSRAGQSNAGTIEETLDDGTKVSRLRAYGSMTYSGFKSYLYAQLPKDDLRVTAAYNWIRRNYSVKENPGMGLSGVYYYYVVFARALKGWGDPVLDIIEPGNTSDTKRRWADDLVDRLSELQNEDGSFKSVDKRWMEDDQVLIAAYALIAMHQCAE